MYTSWPKDENAEAVQAYARREIVRLERGLVFLEVLTGLGPLLGLMGTILGLIRIFSSAGHAAEISAQSAQIAAGIAEAMYCTVAGLVVAIPALIAHSLFSRHIEALTIDLETLCSELLGKLYTQSESTSRYSNKTGPWNSPGNRAALRRINIINLIDTSSSCC